MKRVTFSRWEGQSYSINAGESESWRMCYVFVDGKHIGFLVKGCDTWVHFEYGFYPNEDVVWLGARTEHTAEQKTRKLLLLSP